MDRSVVPFGKPRGERADAARNRERLLEAAREMLAEHGAEKVTMDGLAERAGLGKGTVFRRFGTRAGIFRALLDADERDFQERVLSGPPPLGPGADPVTRLVAYGRARITFLVDHHAVARAAFDRSQPVPAGDASVSQLHIRMLLGQAGVRMPSMNGVTVQLTAALEGPLLLYLSMPETSAPPDPEVDRFLGDGWQALIERIAR
ncbi:MULTISPECIES: TetR/AcrR family transcriptional regulator [unclassified Streptomyces]|uniref:TetR/AcrR family transcriptional regulator n=1 Tax=unclassified Streptomyces TaxID=2593676 RepID=UPI0036EF0AB5